MIYKKIIKALCIFLSVKNSVSFEFGTLSNIFHVPPETAHTLVKASTAILPKFDSVSHIVLNTNEMLINKLLDSNLDPAFKKKLILQVIQMTKEGDDMGGVILQYYYNFIDKLL
jgi:hypothetical protein